MWTMSRTGKRKSWATLTSCPCSQWRQMESVRNDAGAKGSVYGAAREVDRREVDAPGAARQRRFGKGNRKGKSKGDGRNKGGKKVFATWRSPDSTRRISKFVMPVNVAKLVEFSHDS